MFEKYFGEIMSAIAARRASGKTNTSGLGTLVDLTSASTQMLKEADLVIAAQAKQLERHEQALAMITQWAKTNNNLLWIMLSDVLDVETED